MYVGNDGGVWSSANASNPVTVTGAQIWTDLNSGLALTQFNPGFSIHPANVGLAFGGTQSNGTQIFQNVGGVPSWTGTNTCVDGGFTVVDANDQSAVYLSCAGSFGAPQIYKSVTGGASGAFNLLASSSTIGVQLNGTHDPLAPYPPLAADPQRSGHLYYATYRLFETTDAGATWDAASGDLTSGGLANLVEVTSVAFAPISGAAYNLYSGATDGTVEVAMNVSPGTSGTFANISGSLPARSVTKIISDSADVTGKTAYAAFSGFSMDVSISGSLLDLTGHIFKTSNGGASWTDVSCHTSDCAVPLGTDLPNTPANDVVLDPDDSTRGTLYAATDLGMFVTVNGGTTWAQMGSSLPNVPVISLALHEPSRTLRAATHGRSAWDYSLPGLVATPPFALSGISPSSVQAGSAAFTLTLSGSGFTANSTVRWNGASTGITGVIVNTGTQTISAQIAASLIAQPGTASVNVFDSSITANNTNALSLIILGSAPALSTVLPSSANVGASDTAITITGTGFNQNAQVMFKNSAIGVTGITVNAAGTQITATLSHTLLTTGGQFFIGVTNPPPGGGAASPQLLFTVNGPPPPANDNFASATAVTTSIYTSTVDNSGATTEVTDPVPPCVANLSQIPSGKSVWWRYTAGSTGTAVASTLGSSYDTVLSAYTGTAGSFTNVACNNDVSSSVKQSQIQINVISGTTYFFMVTPFDTSLCPPVGTNSADCGGSTIFNFSAPIPAGLVATPPTASITAGGSATFTIGTLSPPLSGQVTFSIAGCPPAATCTFSASSVVAGGSLTLNVTTMANGIAPVIRNLRREPFISLPWVACCGILFSMMMFIFDKEHSAAARGRIRSDNGAAVDRMGVNKRLRSYGEQFRAGGYRRNHRGCLSIGDYGDWHWKCDGHDDRHSDRELIFAAPAWVAQSARNLLRGKRQGSQVHISAAQNNSYSLAFGVDAAIQRRRGGNRSRRFHHNLHSFPQKFHRGDNLSFSDGGNFIHKSAENRESSWRKIRAQAIGNGVVTIERNDMTGSQRLESVVGTFRLGAHDSDLRTNAFCRDGRAGKQSTSGNWRDDEVQIRNFFQ